MGAIIMTDRIEQFGLLDLVKMGEDAATEVSKMTSIELSSFCDVLFRTNPHVAEWIKHDLEVRAMDKEFVDMEKRGELKC